MLSRAKFFYNVENEWVTVVNDFTDPNIVLDQNHFIAQVNTLHTNAIVTRANQLWICGFGNAS